MEFHFRQKSPEGVSTRVRASVHALGQVPPFNRMGSFLYDQISLLCLKRLNALDPLTRFIYRPSFSGKIAPGLSDLDFTMVLRQEDNSCVAASLLKARGEYLRLKARYRLPGEVLAFTPSLKNLFSRVASPLGWYVGEHAILSHSLSRVGLSLQFYLLAVSSLRLAMTHGETSHFSAVFLRELRKAFAALTGIREVQLSGFEASEQLGLFLKEAMENAGNPAPHEGPPSSQSPLEQTLSERFRKRLGGAGLDTRLTALPLLLAYDPGRASEDVALAFVRYLRAEPSPVVLLPEPLARILERGYCGWRQFGSHWSADTRALWERALMQLPCVLGEVVYGSVESLQQHQRSLSGLFIELSRRAEAAGLTHNHPIAPPSRATTIEGIAEELAALASWGQRILCDNLSLGGFGSTV